MCDREVFALVIEEKLKIPTSYSIHVIVEYNQAGSEIICRQISLSVLRDRFWLGRRLIQEGDSHQTFKDYYCFVCICDRTQSAKLTEIIIFTENSQKFFWVGGFCHGSVRLQETTISFCPALS